MHIPASRLLSLLLIPPVLGGVLITAGTFVMIL